MNASQQGPNVIELSPPIEVTGKHIRYARKAYENENIPDSKQWNKYWKEIKLGVSTPKGPHEALERIEFHRRICPLKAKFEDSLSLDYQAQATLISPTKTISELARSLGMEESEARKLRIEVAAMMRLGCSWNPGYYVIGTAASPRYGECVLGMSSAALQALSFGRLKDPSDLIIVKYAMTKVAMEICKKLGATVMLGGVKAVNELNTWLLMEELPPEGFEDEDVGQGVELLYRATGGQGRAGASRRVIAEHRKMIEQFVDFTRLRVALRIWFRDRRWDEKAIGRMGKRLRMGQGVVACTRNYTMEIGDKVRFCDHAYIFGNSMMLVKGSVAIAVHSSVIHAFEQITTRMRAVPGMCDLTGDLLRFSDLRRMSVIAYRGLSSCSNLLVNSLAHSLRGGSAREFIEDFYQKISQMPEYHNAYIHQDKEEMESLEGQFRRTLASLEPYLTTLFNATNEQQMTVGVTLQTYVKAMGLCYFVSTGVTENIIRGLTTTNRPSSFMAHLESCGLFSHYVDKSVTSSPNRTVDLQSLYLILAVMARTGRLKKFENVAASSKELTAWMEKWA
jgi:hypothetical protein